MNNITPDFEKWLKTKMPISAELRLEFFDRLDNLCDQSGLKMTNALEDEIEELFGLEMVKIIEDYADIATPRLPSSIQRKIYRHIDPRYSLEMLRLFTLTCEGPHLYFAANIPVEGGFVDELVAGEYGNQSIPVPGIADGGIVLASFLQTNVTEFSGGGLLDGDASYSFWVLADIIPEDWTWNGNPIVFADLGEAALVCGDTGVFNIVDSALDAPFGFNSADLGTFTVQGALVYNDPGMQAQMDTKIVQFAGVGATVVVTVDTDLNTVRVVVSDTYLPLKDMVSLISGVGPQLDAFNPCA